MVSEKFKKNIDAATAFIESCWDENNEGDGLSFDERVESRIDGLDEDVADIVRGCMDW